ncbi:DMT family transporter [Mycobacteroides abscessus]|uniref:Small Multidrug Resistance family protein n=2 Tax=Mycobacteroides abscessus TaxID=36809 RepID=X8DGV3_9MYCO|nr:DMT family transporter [Mycobacteroides abscessus]EUA67266.1 small Multidrug Resistance family protein [Mycobacteroides abscessus subsp. bolletii 1513]AMU67971.1 transporter [Mycobacteroides abscessus]AMU77694.1 transporter [Mycobacteroides abscessus]ANO01353.1 transporter [Mycobacteroides abscessus]ANO16506.1 transporter [Mycobacteroides abscessus]
MPPGIVAIVLVAAVAHAIWNTASKYKHGDTVLFVWASSCLAALLCVPIGAAAVVTGSQAINGQLAAGSTVSAVLHVVYFLTLQTGYDRFDLGVIYPVARGTGPILTVLCAILLLGERPTRIAGLGAVAIIIGIIVVAGVPRHSDRRAVPAVYWGAATGAAIAAYTLWDSYAVTTLHLNPVAFFTSTFLLQGLMLTPRALRLRSHIASTITSNTAPILIVAVFTPLAYILVLIAMQSAPLALVAPLRESSIVIGSLLAWWLFHENHLWRRIIGATIVLAGIATISL